MRSFEPEPVTVTVIGIVIIVDDTLIGKALDHLLRIVAMQTSMIKPTATKTLIPGNVNGNGLGLGKTRAEHPLASAPRRNTSTKTRYDVG